MSAAWVTDAVAAQLTPAGQFAPATATPRQLSRIAADSVARAVTALLRPGMPLDGRRVELVAERGAAIDFDQLSPCGRPTYVAVATAAFPTGAPGWLRRAFGPYWNVPMCALPDTRAQLAIGVPDGPRDFTIVNDTIVLASMRRSGGGGDWLVLAVSAAFTQGMAVTAEEAVATVFAAARTRVSAVPRAMIQMDTRLVPAVTHPACAAWRIALERPVRVRGAESGESREVSELFVKRDGSCVTGPITMYAPLSTQPATYTYRFPKDTAAATPIGETLPLDSVVVTVNGLGRFERVAVVP